MDITKLFSPLERLIEEHGSASIQAKHIALLREQLSILKDQFSVTERKTTELERENRELRSDNQNLKAQIQQLENSTNGFAFRRGLYFASGDEIPFCPQCWEASSKRIHMVRTQMMSDKVECWDCRICDSRYTAKENENFTGRTAKFRAK